MDPDAVPPSIPSMTGLPLFRSNTSSSAGVKLAVGGPPPVPATSLFFLAAAIVKHHETGQLEHQAGYMLKYLHRFILYN